MLDNSILLVEDNPDDEELIKREFRLNHVLNPILVVRDGEEALDFNVLQNVVRSLGFQWLHMSKSAGVG